MAVVDLSSTDPLINRVIEGYHIIKRIGEGTYGVVYMARHPRITERLVAVKYIKLDDPAEIRSVQREVEVLARLQHPNIVDIYDTYRFDRYQLIVMELVRGGTLLDALQKLQRPLSLQTGIYIVEQLAFALGYVHAQNILHLDLKPANILLDPVADGNEARPLLTDFGIARMINPGGLSSSNIMGTPMYMSPEHFGFGDNKPDHRSDIYSLGIILYELTVGDYPFKATEILDLLNQHAYTPVPLPSRMIADLPGELDAIVMRSLAKLPEERFQSANDMAAALRELRLSEMLRRVRWARLP
jgi:serine/threonine protein kinase